MVFAKYKGDPFFDSFTVALLVKIKTRGGSGSMDTQE